MRFDRDGRVIRLESFSKVLSPGARLGYYVCNPLFAERLLRATEVESQTPSGWSQGIIYSLLQTWGRDGYLTWLSRLRDTYQTRRDAMCGAFAKHFTALPAKDFAAGVKGAEGIVLYPAGIDVQSIKTDQQPLASFVPPSAGMFCWVALYLAGAPRFRELLAQGHEDPEKQFMDELWEALADNLVLLTPGSYYVPWEGVDRLTTSARGARPGIGYLRFAFSYEDVSSSLLRTGCYSRCLPLPTALQFDVMAEGVKRFEEVIRKMWDA